MKQDIFECRYGGWDGKRWLSDVYVMDTSNFFTLCLFSLFFVYSVIVTEKMLYLIGVRLDCKVLCFVKQYHLSGWSCR